MTSLTLLYLRLDRKPKGVEISHRPSSTSCTRCERTGANANGRAPFGYVRCRFDIAASDFSPLSVGATIVLADPRPSRWRRLTTLMAEADPQSCKPPRQPGNSCWTLGGREANGEILCGGENYLVSWRTICSNVALSFGTVGPTRQPLVNP